MIQKQQLKESIKKLREMFPLEGEITLIQSEDGKFLPETKKVFHNTIGDDLYIQLFHEMYDGTGDLYLDDLCTAGTGVKDGIVAAYSSDPHLYDQLDTAYNSGGDGVDDTEIEYYGALHTALSADRDYNAIYLVKDFAVDGSGEIDPGQLFALKSISYSVTAGRRLHAYYKIRKPV